MNEYVYLPPETRPSEPKQSPGRTLGATGLHALRGIENIGSLLSFPENLVGKGISKLVGGAPESFAQFGQDLGFNQHLDQILEQAGLLPKNYTEPTNFAENVLYRTAEKAPLALATGGAGALAHSAFSSAAGAGLEKAGVGEFGQAVGELVAGLGSSYAQNRLLKGNINQKLGKVFNEFDKEIPGALKGDSQPISQYLEDEYSKLSKSNMSKSAENFIRRDIGKVHNNILEGKIPLKDARRLWLQTNKFIYDPATPSEALPYLVSQRDNYSKLFQEAGKANPAFGEKVGELINANEAYSALKRTKVDKWINSDKANSVLRKIPILGNIIGAFGDVGKGAVGAALRPIEASFKSKAARKLYGDALKAISKDNVSQLIKRSGQLQKMVDKTSQNESEDYIYL